VIRALHPFLFGLRQHPRLTVPALLLAAGASATAVVLLWAHYHLHAAQQALQRYDLDQAQHHLDLCLRVRFGSAAVNLLAAQTARRREDYDRAERHLAACLEVEGMTEASGRERLLLGVQRGDLQDVEGLRQARSGEDDEGAVLVLEALAIGHVNRFAPQDALECLNSLLQRRPRHPQALLMRARAWEALARSGRSEAEQEALHDYERAVEANPTFAARLGLAGALYRVGRPLEAALLYERLREQADNPDVLLGLARCRFNLGELDEARHLLDELLAQHPDHPAGLVERGALAFHARQLGEAEKWLRRAAALAPPCDGLPERLLGQCLEVAHKDEEARRSRDRLRRREAESLRVDRLVGQSNQDPHNLALRLEAVRTLMRHGREQDAAAGLFRILDQAADSRPAQAALADYFERSGQPARAARHRRLSLGR
jgi:tetratricopeptide (TPR) repeat protein